MLSSYQDNELLKMIRQDSAAAFSEIYDRYWSSLYGIAYKRLRSKEAAEEIVQEAFVALWEKRKTSRIDSLPAYLSAIIKYSVFHYVAKQKYRDTKLKSIPLSAVVDPIEVIEDRILLQLVELSAKELPAKCRTVFRYSKQYGYSIEEIATHMSISPKTAESHLTKALKFIRLKLGNLYLWIILVAFSFLL
ncbi:MAG: sigma-70 family RNA polymerase sigma factor [Bacteroidota bacterium]